MRIIITGAGGFIGKAVVETLLQLQAKITCIDLPGVDHTWFDTYNAGNAPDDCFWIEQDLAEASVQDWTDWSVLGQDTELGFIYHLASTVGVQTVIDNPEVLIEDLKINTILAEYLRGVITPLRLAFTSTSEIYGEQQELVEEGPLIFNTPDGNPRGVYAAQKLAAEHLFLNCLPANIVVNVLRLFSISGVGQSQDFVLPKMVQQAVNNDPITIYGDGSQSRMFTDIKDLINFAMTFSVMNTMTEEGSRIINICNVWNYTTIYQLANRIKAVLGSTSEVVYEDGPIGEKSRIPQINRMLEIYKPQISLDTMIQEIAEDLQPGSVPEPFIITDASLTTTVIPNPDPQQDDIDEITIVINGTGEAGATLSAFFADNGVMTTTINGGWTITYTTQKDVNGYIELEATINDIRYSSGRVLVDTSNITVE